MLVKIYREFLTHRSKERGLDPLTYIADANATRRDWYGLHDEMERRGVYDLPDRLAIRQKIEEESTLYTGSLDSLRGLISSSGKSWGKPEWTYEGESLVATGTMKGLAGKMLVMFRADLVAEQRDEYEALVAANGGSASWGMDACMAR